MSRLKRFWAIGLSLAVLLTGLVGSAQAQGAGRPSDPESVHVQARHAQLEPDALPTSVNSDVYASAVSPNFHTYFILAGHLKLALATGSSTQYTGSFVDYSGNKAYAARVDATNASTPSLHLNSKNGHFEFNMDNQFGTSFYSGTGTSVPSALGQPANQVFFYATAHSLHSASYNIVVSQRVGPIAAQFEYEGTMTFTYDANSRISGGQVTVEDANGRNVTSQLSDSGYYSTGYLYTAAYLNHRKFGLAATFSGTSFSGNAFTGSSMSQWVFTGTPV